MGIIIELLITMAFSAFFSGMEIAFVSSNKLRFEMEKSNNFSTKILTVFYNNPNNFISTMLVGNNIALVIYGILMAEIIENKLLSGLITNEALLVVIQTIISTFIILITGEFLPKTIFKINPNLTLKYLCIPTYICYLVLYPISKFSAMLSTSILTLTGKKIKKEDREKAFSKVDLDYLISLTGLSCYKPDLWLMAYDEKGCPAGCAIAEIGREINEGYIEWLQVLPPFRRKGLGSALVSELLRRMALGGADFCTVSGKASNPSAPEALYRKCGFEGNGLWLVFKKQ